MIAQYKFVTVNHFWTCVDDDISYEIIVLMWLMLFDADYAALCNLVHLQQVNWIA